MLLKKFSLRTKNGWKKKSARAKQVTELLNNNSYHNLKWRNKGHAIRIHVHYMPTVTPRAAATSFHNSLVRSFLLKSTLPSLHSVEHVPRHCSENRRAVSDIAWRLRNIAYALASAWLLTWHNGCPSLLSVACSSVWPYPKGQSGIRISATRTLNKFLPLFLSL
jgi:hypothetical protein